MTREEVLQRILDLLSTDGKFDSPELNLNGNGEILFTVEEDDEVKNFALKVEEF